MQGTVRLQTLDGRRSFCGLHLAVFSRGRKQETDRRVISRSAFWIRVPGPHNRRVSVAVIHEWDSQAFVNGFSSA
jgi:hypothetical protein